MSNAHANAALINRITHGDSLDIMRQQIEDNSIDLTVTSPPYDNLRTYNGYSFDFEGIAQELYRVTKPGGVVVWIVNDATIKGSESGTSFRQALYFKDIGFNLHDTMIYAKNNYVPLTHNRYEQQFEYMFILSKGKPVTFNPMKESRKSAGTVRNRYTKVRKYDGDSVRFRYEITEVKNEKIKPNIWFYSVGKGHSAKDTIAHSHPAIFPEQLAEDHIVTWSNEGDTILDVFGGSGTTAKMSAINNRNFIHIDISEEYCEIARKRIEQALAEKAGA